MEIGCQRVRTWKKIGYAGEKKLGTTALDWAAAAANCMGIQFQPCGCMPMQLKENGASLDKYLWMFNILNWCTWTLMRTMQIPEQICKISIGSTRVESLRYFQAGPNLGSFSDLSQIYNQQINAEVLACFHFSSLNSLKFTFLWSQNDTLTTACQFSWCTKPISSNHSLQSYLKLQFLILVVSET